MEFDDLMDCYIFSKAESNRITYNELLTYLQDRKVIPFFGAGVSCWAYPLWTKTLYNLAEPLGIKKAEIDVYLKENRYEDAASFIANKHGIQSFPSHLHAEFNPAIMEEKETNRYTYTSLFPRIFTGPMITTNFDRCIEHVFNKTNNPLEVLTPLDSYHAHRIEKGLHEGERILLKMHGDVEDQEHIIFTKEAYELAYGENGEIDMNKQMPKFLSSVLVKMPLLFLGCSLQPDRTCEVLKKCAPDHRHFAFVEMPKETKNNKNPLSPRIKGRDKKLKSAFESRRDYLLNERNLHIIWYPYGMHIESFEALFKQIAKDLSIIPAGPSGTDANSESKNADINPNTTAESTVRFLEDSDLRNLLNGTVNSFLDPIAVSAHENKDDLSLFRVIFDASVRQNCFSNQSKSLRTKSSRTKSSRTKNSLLALCTHIKNSKQKFPVTIQGSPGTGKSTLLSLLYLNTPISHNQYKFIINLHKFNKQNGEDPKVKLQKILNELDLIVPHADHTYFFVDGIDNYIRSSGNLSSLITEFSAKHNANKLQLILSKGIVSDQYFPPFKRFSSELLNAGQLKINLDLADFSDRALNKKLQNLLAFYGLISKSRIKSSKNKADNKRYDRAKDYDMYLDKVSLFCKKIGGNKINFRTLIFCVKRFEVYGEKLFGMKIGQVLRDYFESFYIISNMKQYAADVTDFMLGTNSTVNWSSSAVFKSPIYQDFFFAYHYINYILGISTDNIEKFNCIFTASINRIVVDLMSENLEKELSMLNSLTYNYPNMSPRAQAQAAYLIGRVSHTQSKKTAISFLKNEYRQLLDKYDSYTSDSDWIMLFRSVGVSLIYLNYTDHENSFFKKLIYDESIKRINLNFHIAYYCGDGYKIGNDVQVESDSYCTVQNLNKLYFMLYNSISGATNIAKQGLSIITIISLYIRMQYHSLYEVENGERRSDLEVESIRADFGNLLKDLSNNPWITNTQLKSYLLGIIPFVTSQNVYVDALAKLYSMKHLTRKGWFLLGREIDKGIEVFRPTFISEGPSTPNNLLERIESIADHSWACCMIAMIFLNNDINRCQFLSDEEKQKFANSYSLSSIMSYLVIHDLPEIYTDDIPDNENSDNIQKQESERYAMNSLQTLDSFPKFNTFSSISTLWSEYESKEDINSIIAYQIDKIEPLIQLFFYRKYLPVNEISSQRNEWISQATKRIQDNNPLAISFGNSLLHFLSVCMLNEDVFTLL